MTIGIAYTREISPRLADCELTHLTSEPIDIARAIRQHHAYEDALAEAGFAIRRLPALPDHPDGVFVEDCALLLGEHVIVTRPGAASRAGETASTEAALASDFIIHRLAEGTLDGGDVLRIGRTLYAGRSARTSDAGIAALARTAGALGFDVVPVEIDHCLHLKSAVTFAGPDSAGTPVLLYHADWISPDAFTGAEPVAAHPDEPNGANVLRAGDRLCLSGEAPRTADLLARRGFDVVMLKVSELHKAESGLTCMSLIAG